MSRGRSALVVAVAAAGTLLAACTAPATPGAGATSTTAASAGPSSSRPTSQSGGSILAPGGTARDADVMFAQMMIPHHEQAVEMSDLALSRSGTGLRVRELATAIRAAQAPEIALLRTWLAEWGAAPTMDPSHNHGMPGLLSVSDLQRLRAAGDPDFDRLWVRFMIDHHLGAVQMAQDVLRSSTDARVRALAESISTSQQAEIATMRTMLAAG